MLASNREEIEAGRLRVLLIDECHLLWGDLTGYVWGKTDQEIAVGIVNERDKQTYYGAIDYLNGKLLLQAYNAGNSDNTIDYLRYLLDLIFSSIENILCLLTLCGRPDCIPKYGRILPLNIFLFDVLAFVEDVGAAIARLKSNFRKSHCSQQG